jgi:nucleoside-diphosphate-sugar epimerase
MKITVTGGKGFLGSNLISKILNMNHEVLIISRDTENIEQKILNFNPDVFVHCAWGGGNNYKDINNIEQINNVYNGIHLI